MRNRQARLQRLQLKVWSGLVWYACWGSLDLPPVAFLHEDGSVGVFKSGDDLVDGAAPDLTVSNKCRPLVVVNVAGNESLLERAFKTFLWCPSVAVASGEFTIQGYLGQVMPPPPFWSHALAIVAVTSATWPLCWWFLPDQGPHELWTHLVQITFLNKPELFFARS